MYSSIDIFRAAQYLEINAAQIADSAPDIITAFTEYVLGLHPDLVTATPKLDEVNEASVIDFCAQTGLTLTDREQLLLTIGMEIGELQVSAALLDLSEVPLSEV